MRPAGELLGNDPLKDVPDRTPEVLQVDQPQSISTDRARIQPDNPSDNLTKSTRPSQRHSRGNGRCRRPARHSGR
jgi:hypothetical protein